MKILVAVVQFVWLDGKCKWYQMVMEYMDSVPPHVQQIQSKPTVAEKTRRSSMFHSTHSGDMKSATGQIWRKRSSSA